jgi:1,4-alpha-glucan branching enzyme
MNTTLTSHKSFKQNSILFDFTAPAARQVTLAGDFNNWDPKALPMHKGADGGWHLSVALKPGRHEYRFIADGAWQDDPAAQQRTANAMGSENSVRIVSV